MTLNKLNRLRDLAKLRLKDNPARCKHISFILRRNKVVCFCENNINKTCTFHHYCNFAWPYIHSEVGVIKKCPDDINLNQCRLVVIRVGGEDNELMMSKPCKKCEKVLKKMEFKEVIYSVEGGYQKLEL